MALSPSTTILTLSSQNVSVDTPIQLSAAVTQNSAPVTAGTVTFLNGSKVLGTATLAGFRPATNHTTGVATLWMKFGVGSYPITARFAGTSKIAISVSSPLQLSVSGFMPSFTSVVATLNGFNFDLTSSVLGWGSGAVAGTVALLDRTTSTSLGSVTLASPRTAFLAQSGYSTGTTPNAVAIGDLNGDGVLDIVTANSGTGDVSILMGDAYNRGFLIRQFKQTAGKGAAAVVIVDLNGDGAPDIAVANSTDGTVSVILSSPENPGAGFAAQVTYAVGRAPTAIVAGDVNGDGICDLLVTNRADNTVSVLLGDPANPGGFLPAVTYATGLSPVSLALGDWTGDGVLDIAVANSAESTVSILPGDPAHPGQFLNKLNIAVSNSPTALVGADLNNDGSLDLAVLFAAKNTVAVLLQDATHPGQFLAQQTYPVGSTPTAITTGYLNINDKCPGLFVSNSGDNTVSTLLTDPAHPGQFLSAQNYAVGGQPSAIAAADLNGDGVPDIIVTNAATNTASVLLGGTMSQGVLPNVPLSGIGPHTIQASYTTGLVYTSSLGTTTATVTPVSTTTTLTASVDGQPLPPSRIVGSAQVLVLAAAFTPAVANGVNANGTVSFTDGATPIPACPTTFVVDGNGNGFATCSPTLVSGAHNLKANFNAINGGHFASSTSPAIPLTVVVLSASNLILTGPSTALSGVAAQYKVVVIDQLNSVVTGFTGTAHFASGDSAAILPSDYSFNIADAGRLIFPVTFFTGGTQTLSVSTTTGVLPIATLPVTVSVNSSTTLAVNAPIASLGQATTLIAQVTAGGTAVPSGTVTFLDGARRLGSAQLVGLAPASGFNTGSAQIRVRLALGSHAIVAFFGGVHTILPSASGPQSVVISGSEPTSTLLNTLPNGANYDLIATVSGLGPVAPAGTVSFTDTTASLSLGTAAVLPPAEQSFLASPYVAASILTSLVTSDLNGDGIPDIAAVSPLDDKVAVILGDPSNVGRLMPPAMYSVGSKPDSIALADCNADGVPDLFVANSNDGTLGVLLGIGDGTFQAQRTVAVGKYPASIAVGDWNVDGILDVAVANSGDKTVSILMGNGDCTFHPRQSYSVGNTPTAVTGVDLNGDGVADLVVTNGDDSTVSVLIGKGDGTFLPAANYPVGGYPVGIQAGNFTSDAFVDLAILNRDSMFISLLPGKGDGTFQVSTPVALLHKASAFALSQPTAAGTRNLVIANSDDASFTTLPGKGDGSFGPATDTALNFVPGSIALNDWDGDGLEDALLTSSSTTDSVLETTATSVLAQLANVPLLGLGPHNVQAIYAPGTGVSATASISNVVALAGGLGAQNITFAALPPVIYGSLPLTLNAVSTSNLQVIFGVISGPCSMGGSTLVVSGAGQCIVEADQAGDASYAPASSILQTLTVTPASLTVTPDPATRIFGGANPLFTGTVAGLVNADNITATYASGADQLTAPGVFSAGVDAIHASLVDANGRMGNYSVAFNLGTLTISRAAQNISFDPLSPVTYSTSTIPLNASSGSLLSILYSVVSGPARISGTTLTATGAGSVVLQADQPGNGNYLPAQAAVATLTVNPAPLLVTPNAASRSFAAPNPLFSGLLSGVIAGDAITATYASASTANTPMGIYSSGPNAITATLVDANNRLANYSITQSQGTLTITQATQVITFPAMAAVSYGVGPVSLIASATSALPVSFRVLSGPGIVSESTLTPTGAGIIILAADQAGNSTFPAAATVQQSLTISKATLVVTPTAVTRALGAQNPIFTGVLSGVIASDNITATYTSASNASTPIGIYSTASNGIISTLSDPSARISNYVVVQSIGTLTITQPTQTITFLPLSPVVYSSVPLTLNASASSGLKVSYRILSGPCTISGSNVTYTGAGTVVIEADQGGSAGFPAATPVQQSLLISRAQLTVTPSPASRAYGTGNPLFVGSIAGAIPADNLSATYASTATPGTTVGSYAILATINDPNNKASSYNVSVATAFLTITKATLMVSADDVTHAYGLSTTQLTGEVSGAYSGDTITAIYSTPALITSPPGRYAITAQVVGANPVSYSVVTKPATLTITRANVSASLKLSSQAAGTGTSVTATAIVASSTTGAPGGTIAFFDGQVNLGALPPDALGQAVLSSAAFAAGTHSITASYSGDVDFNPAGTSGSTLVIGVPDYGVTGSSPTLTISPGQSALLQLSITPIFGFNQPLTYSCGTLPKYITCQFTPGVTAPGGTTVTPVQLTVSVATTTSWLKSSSNMMLAAIVPLSLIGFIPIAVGRHRWRVLQVLLVLSIAMTGLMVGCGGGGAGGAAASQPTAPAPPSTAPSGTQTINVTVSSGPISHQLPLTIIIKGS